MILFKKDLILEEDTTFDESIKVIGNIKGDFNLTINGNIIAHDIDVLNIKACNIKACNMDTWDIEALDIIASDIKAFEIKALDIIADNIIAEDITAEDINANYIICEKRIKKSKDAKAIAQIFIDNKSKLENKEMM